MLKSGQDEAGHQGNCITTHEGAASAVRLRWSLSDRLTEESGLEDFLMRGNQMDEEHQEPLRPTLKSVKWKLFSVWVEMCSSLNMDLLLRAERPSGTQ